MDHLAKNTKVKAQVLFAFSCCKHGRAHQNAIYIETRLYIENRRSLKDTRDFFVAVGASLLAGGLCLPIEKEPPALQPGVWAALPRRVAWGCRQAQVQLFLKAELTLCINVEYKRMCMF